MVRDGDEADSGTSLFFFSFLNGPRIPHLPSLIPHHPLHPSGHLSFYWPSISRSATSASMASKRDESRIEGVMMVERDGERKRKRERVVERWMTVAGQFSFLSFFVLLCQRPATFPIHHPTICRHLRSPPSRRIRSFVIHHLPPFHLGSHSSSNLY